MFRQVARSKLQRHAADMSGTWEKKAGDNEKTALRQLTIFEKMAR